MYELLHNTNKLYVCAGERLKMIGTVNGLFPDMGHHLAKEMNGVWLHPIKLLDGFWMRFQDHSTNGEVDCWINADGFANYPYGNEFFYNSGLSHTKMSIQRFQFSPDDIGGCVVKYTLRNNSEKETTVTCELLARTDLRPVWLAEKINIFDGSQDIVTYNKEQNIFIAKDNEHEWYAAFGCNIVPDRTKTGQFFASEITAGNGVSASMEFDLSFAPCEQKEFFFFIAGSDASKEDCLTQYRLLQGHENLLEQKKLRYENIQKKTELITPDLRFNEIYDWIKVNTDWLVQNVPGYGRGLTAGIPEYPWWFGCDNCYSIMGLLAIGEAELARQTLQIILEASEKENGNGRIIHEVITNGVICNQGNTQETAHFIYTVWEYFQWTNDIEFVKRCIPYMEKSIAWLEEMDEDHDLFPSGYGIIEIAGLNMEMIDSAVYTCMAYDCFSKIYQLLGEDKKAAHSRELHEKTKQSINERYWIKDRGLYADTITSTNIVKDRLERILRQSGDSAEETRRYLNAEILKKSGDTKESGWLLNEAWIITTPMETGIAPKEYADTALKLLHTDRFVGEYGAYLSGLSHRHTMTISTGVFAVSQARYGYTDRALELLSLMFKTYGMATPGSLSEMSPNYGCFAQAWTIFGVGVSIVKYFFGLQPNAYKKEILFSPNMPKAWDSVALNNVQLLDGAVSIEFRRVQDKEIYEIENNSSYQIKVDPALQNIEVKIK